MQRNLVHCVIVLCFAAALASEKFVSRLKRSVHDRKTKLIPCGTAFMKCAKNERCATALNKLEQLCKVTADRCNAKMEDLPRCGQIMDHIFTNGLPEKGCSCSDENPKCLRKQKRIGNPCFSAIRHLREHGLFPETLDAYDQVTKPQTTTTTTATTAEPSSSVSENYRSAKFDEDVQILKIRKSETDQMTRDVYHGIESENSSMLTTTVSLPARNIDHPSVTNSIPKATPDSDIVNVEKPHGGANPTKTANKESNRERVVSSTRSKYLGHRQSSLHDTDLRRVIDGHLELPSAMDNRLHDQLKLNAAKRKIPIRLDLVEKLEKSHNIIDYKSIAIILGILLAIVVLSSLIVFLWTRTSKAVLYKKYIFPKDRRMDGEVFSTMQFLSPSSNKS